MQRTVIAAATVAFLLAPAAAFAAGPQELELSAKAQVDGSTVPLDVLVSTENTNVVLSSTKKDGSTPVTFTLYLTPKPKPAPAPVAASTNSTQAAAAVDSSQNIQNGIAQYSPQAASVAQPLFTLIDSGRASAADALDTQIENTKKALGPGAGNVLGAEETKNAGSDPLGAVWFILRTLYLYLLTLLRFVVGSAAVFYPALAIAFLYFIWKLFSRFRRPAY